MKEKMIRRFMKEVEEYNMLVVYPDTDVELLNAKWNIIRGCKIMLKECGMNVIMMNPRNDIIKEFYIDYGHFFYVNGSICTNYLMES